MDTKRLAFDEDSDTCSTIIVVDDEDTNNVTLQTDQNSGNNVQDQSEASQAPVNTIANNDPEYNDDGHNATSSTDWEMDTKKPSLDEDSDSCSTIIVVDDEDTNVTLQTDQNSGSSVQDQSEASQTPINTIANNDPEYNDDGNNGTFSAAVINTDWQMDTKKQSLDEDSDSCSTIIVVDDDDTNVALQTDQNSGSNVQDQSEASQAPINTITNNEPEYNYDGNNATSSVAVINTDWAMDMKKSSLNEDSDSCSTVIVVDDEDTNVPLQTAQNSGNTVQDQSEASQTPVNTIANNEPEYNDDGNNATSSAAVINADRAMDMNKASLNEDSDSCSTIIIVDDEDTNVTLQTDQNSGNSMQDETEASQISINTIVNNELGYNDYGNDASSSAALMNTDWAMDTKRPPFDEDSDAYPTIIVVDDEDTDVTLQTKNSVTNAQNESEARQKSLNTTINNESAYNDDGNDATSTTALINSDCSWSSLENLTDDMGETDTETEIDLPELNAVDQRKSEERKFLPSCSKDSNLKHGNSNATITGIKCTRYSCKRCQYSTCIKQYFNRHIKTFHKAEKSYSCVVCPFKTTRKSTFRKHIYSHTRVQPYVCDICGRSFSRKPSIKRHMDKHARDKP